MQNMTKKHNGRAAFTIVELVAAIMIIAVCMAAFAVIANTARQQRQLGQRHQTAVDQLQNVLELLAANDPKQLAVGAVSLSPCENLVSRALPQGELLVRCKPFPNDDAENDAVANFVQTWQLDASVSWLDEKTQTRRSVSMTRLLSKPMPTLETVGVTVEEPETEPEGGAE